MLKMGRGFNIFVMEIFIREIIKKMRVKVLGNMYGRMEMSI